MYCSHCPTQFDCSSIEMYSVCQTVSQVIPVCIYILENNPSTAMHAQGKRLSWNNPRIVFLDDIYHIMLWWLYHLAVHHIHTCIWFVYQYQYKWLILCTGNMVDFVKVKSLVLCCCQKNGHTVHSYSVVMWLRIPNTVVPLLWQHPKSW